MRGDAGWRAALGRGEIHVWRVSLDVPAAEAAALELELADDERRRAHRFLMEQDRRRYTVHRARLRAILSAYLGQRPTELRFGHAAGGKPFIQGEEAGEQGLRFNAAHSDGLALYSISRGLETGVDVERIRGSLARPWIAERFFKAADAARLSRVPEAEYASEFFACWTRLEAELKAAGRGFTPEPAGHRESHETWTVHEVEPGPGYAGALAVEGHDHQVVYRELPRDQT
jgi:4'-phosphopantetheinyl transferase